MSRGINGGSAYPGEVGGSGGNPPGRTRPRGNIEALASGSLRVRVYAGTDVLTGRRLYLKQTVPAGPRVRQRAQRVLEELDRQVAEGRHPRTNASLTQLVDKHLEVAAVERRGKETLRGYARKHIAPLIGECGIGSVTAELLDSFYAELRRCRDHCDRQPSGRSGRGGVPSGHVCRPLAAGTVRHIHHLLSAAYESAIRWEWVAVNPMRRARKPAAPRPDPQPPSAEEAAALVSESWRRGFGALVWVAMTTGARRGELCALRWGNLAVHHVSGGSHECATAGCRWHLVIRRAIGEGHDGTLWETDTKAHQRRHVALDPETVAVLAEHRGACEHLVQQLGATLVGDHYIFAGSPDGTQPSRPSSVSQRYDRCARRLGIKTTLHRLRHYSATELITAGVDIRTVAGRLGHRDATTTLKVYAAWVCAADQYASTVLMHRMPGRPSAPLDAPHDQPIREPRWPYERIAATLHQAWLGGALAGGSVLTVDDIARSHGVSTGTAHRVITLLGQWGVLQVSSGNRSIVTAREATLPVSAPADHAAGPSSRTETSHPITESESDRRSRVGRRALTLDLAHLGTTIRTLRTQADPDDLDGLQQVMRDAVRRVAGESAQLGEYEMTVHLADESTPVTTVVIAA